MNISTDFINKIKFQIENYLLFCLANDQTIQFLKKEEPGIYEAIEIFLLRKAKRIRPTIIMLTYNSYTESDDKSVIHAALALELMHTFALIHDDIIDQSGMREKTPTLHTTIGKKSNGDKFSGERMAMLIGDLIYNIALNEFHKVNLNDKQKAYGMQLLLDTALRTSRGQLMEMIQQNKPLPSLTAAQILKVYDLKTAHYTFCLPMQMGAFLSGQNKKELKILKKIGLNLGRAYQIIDDINDLSANQIEINNYLAVLLWKQIDKDEKKKLIVFFESKNSNDNNKKWLFELYNKHSIPQLADKKAQTLIEEAESDIDTLNLKDEAKKEWKKFIASIMEIKQ